MVTAAAGSDAAVVLVDITKLDWHAPPGGAAAADAPPRAAGAPAARAEHRVRGQQARRAGASRGTAFDAVRAALLAFAAEAGIAVAAIVPVSALRGDNVTQPLDAAWYHGPSLLQLLESLPTTQERVDGALLLPVQYVAREPGEQADGTGHQPRTLWGRIAHGRVRAGDAVQLFPSGERATVVGAAPRRQRGRRGRGRPVGRAGPRPPARRVARRLDRHARRRCCRRSASAPRWPGWTPSPPSSAASTGAPRQPLGAGAHHLDRAPARHPHAGAHRRARAGGQRHRPRGRSRRSSRCRWSPMRTTASAAR